MKVLGLVLASAPLLALPLVTSTQPFQPTTLGSADPSQVRDWIVVCEADIIEIDDAPTAGHGRPAPIEVKFEDLSRLAGHLNGKVHRTVATSEALAKEHFAYEMQRPDDSTYNFRLRRADDETVVVEFVGHIEDSIPIDGLWLIRPGGDFVHIIAADSRESDGSGGYDVSDRQIAYATHPDGSGGVTYHVISAPLMAFDRALLR